MKLLIETFFIFIFLLELILSNRSTWASDYMKSKDVKLEKHETSYG